MGGKVQARKIIYISLEIINRYDICIGVRMESLDIQSIGLLFTFNGQKKQCLNLSKSSKSRGCCIKFFMFIVFARASSAIRSRVNTVMD